MENINMDIKAIEKAKEHFGKVLEEQLARVEKMKESVKWIDYSSLKPIRIGIIGGDGIGPYISKESRSVFEYLLAGEISSGRVELATIKGLTIENRARFKKAIPDDVLEEIKTCHVILKGPTTTPRKGDPWRNVYNIVNHSKTAI